MRNRDLLILIFVLIAVSILLGVAGLVLGIIATTSRVIEPTSVSDDSPVKVYALPPQAVMIDDSTYAIEYPEHNVHGIALISWPKNDTRNNKRSHVSSSGAQKVVHNECLGNINPNTRWRTVEDYIVDPSNTEGLSTRFISDAANLAATTWNSYLAFKPFGRQIIGTLNGGTSFTGQNGLTFGAIDIAGSTHAIAVTVVYWSCTSVCSYVEWKQIYNTVNYQFGSGIACAGQIVDTSNTMMHEFGHSIGEKDQYNTICADDTMFGSEGYCERKKITLEDDDIYNARFVIGYGDSGSVKKADASNHNHTFFRALTYALLVVCILV